MKNSHRHDPRRTTASSILSSPGLKVSEALTSQRQYQFVTSTDHHSPQCSYPNPPTRTIPLSTSHNLSNNLPPVHQHRDRCQTIPTNRNQNHPYKKSWPHISTHTRSPARDLLPTLPHHQSRRVPTLALHGQLTEPGT